MSKGCKVKNCNKKFLAKGFCQLHYSHFRFGILDEDGNQLREIFSTRPKGESWQRKMKEVMKDPEVRKKCGWSIGLTKEIDERIKHQADSRKGLIPRNKGLTMEEEFGIKKAKEIKQKISKNSKGKHSGENNANYKGGKPRCKKCNKELYYNNTTGLCLKCYRDSIYVITQHNGYGYNFREELKEKIRNRDGNICQLCFMPNEENKEKFDKSLHNHHIDYDKNNCGESNLISLCNVCNGKVNKDRKKWTNYFQILLSVIDEQNYLTELIDVSYN